MIVVKFKNLKCFSFENDEGTMLKLPKAPVIIDRLFTRNKCISKVIVLYLLLFWWQWYYKKKVLVITLSGM